ncbi:hypothetical protein BES34_021140 [Leptospira inadai serovar Lyme]|uniref:Uncharacterized protein n=1 Tax=Leptospira inadai serovar Lyme TaxID=293084 RepID=A0ABX4YCQ1_9LEPT|nr:hypothetical protein BES34_021140 [Leptospira inadai serovar Lyme]
METPLINVLSPRGLMTEDRGLKLLEVGKVTEVRDKSPVIQKSFCITGNLLAPMFCLLKKQLTILINMISI